MPKPEEREKVKAIAKTGEAVPRYLTRPLFLEVSRPGEEQVSG